MIQCQCNKQGRLEHISQREIELRGKRTQKTVDCVCPPRPSSRLVAEGSQSLAHGCCH
jgi:hypothetical protein